MLLCGSHACMLLHPMHLERRFCTDDERFQACPVRGLARQVLCDGAVGILQHLPVTALRSVMQRAYDDALKRHAGTPSPNRGTVASSCVSLYSAR